MTGSSGPPVRNRLLVRSGLLLRSPLSSPQEPQKNRASGRWMKVPRLANRFHPLFCLVTAIGAQLPPAPCCASLPELPIWLKSFTERPVSRPASARSRAEILLSPASTPYTLAKRSSCEWPSSTAAAGASLYAKRASDSMERLVPEQTLWRSDRWIPRQWTRKSGITFDLLSAVIENRVRRLRRQASRSTRATGRPSSKSTLTAKSYRSMPSAMSTVLPVQIRTGWIMKPRDFAAREDEATNGVCNARSAFEPLPKVDCAKFVFVSSLQADRRIAASRPRESFARQAGNCSGYGGTALGA